MKKRRMKANGTTGFSLFELKDVIASATDSLAEALESQGVSVDTDTLFTELQSLVRRIGTSGSDMPMPNNGMYGMPLMASDAKPPYSAAADLLAMAHGEYESGDKKSAIRATLDAYAHPDMGAIISGLVLMNSNSQHGITTASDEEMEMDEDDGSEAPETVMEEPVKEETSTDKDELSDEDLQRLIDESGNDDSDDSFEDEGDETLEADAAEAEKPEPESKPEDENIPMGRSSSLAASDRRDRVIANKLSQDGSSTALQRAKQFMSARAA